MKEKRFPNLLTGNQLKLIALVTMTCDHVGSQLLPSWGFLRVIGRLAFPIFAYMIAEGCAYTKNRRRYLGVIAAIALLCQLVYLVTESSLYMCIMVTFTLSVLLIFALEGAFKARTPRAYIAAAGALILVLLATVVIPALPTGTDFWVDYGLWGVLLPVGVYFARGKAAKLAAAAAALVLLSLTMGGIQWYSLFALILLFLYSGQRGARPLKNLFYVYYPLHLAVIYLISLVI